MRYRLSGRRHPPQCNVRGKLIIQIAVQLRRNIRAKSRAKLRIMIHQQSSLLFLQITDGLRLGGKRLPFC
jgi:hypothetical protein